MQELFRSATEPTPVTHALGDIDGAIIRQSKPSLEPACCASCASAGACEQGSSSLILRQATDTGRPAARTTYLNSSSHPLDAVVRARMEPAFGADFGNVRVHRDSDANRAAAHLRAKAFTIGQDIYFGHSFYAPESSEGSRLLAHELVHTLQQPRGGAASALDTLRVSTPSDVAEREAESMADQVVGGLSIQSRKAMSVTTQIQGDWLDDVKSAVSGAYDSTASAVSGAVSTVASTVASAYGAVASTVRSGVSAVAEGVQAAVSTVSSVGKAIGSVVSGTAEALSTDPEQTRANLIARVNATRQQVQNADPSAIKANASQIASLNQHVSSLNAALPESVAAVPLVAPLPVVAGPTLIEIIVGILEAIGAALGLTIGGVILLIAIIILAIIAVILFFVDESGKYTKTKPKAGEETEDDTKKEKKPEDKPDGPDFIPICSPTGLTPADAIPMTWFKPVVDDYYPREIILRGTAYGRDDAPTRLPGGEPIGVEPQYWPSVGKTFQIIPEERGPGAGRFRAVLERYGFDWTGLQADHVQDIEFSGPDDSGFVNLWPMDSSANASAGARTQGQPIRMCIGPTDISAVVGTLSELKDAVPHFYGRFFRIRNITR
jgi:hypothetical protein